MSAMRYTLTASERIFKEAVREFAGRAVPAAGVGRSRGPGVPRTLFRELEKLFSAMRPAGLSRVEAVVALEEIVRRCPASTPGIVARGVFGSLSPGLCRAAAGLGAAQGVLARGLSGVPTQEYLSGGVLQGQADALAAIETARLKLYRAALLEDAGRGDAEESEGAERLAEALVREALDLNERIKKGGKDEAGSSVQEGDRDGHRQRPEGPGGDPQAPRS
jgi:hypothetical protein